MSSSANRHYDVSILGDRELSARFRSLTTQHGGKVLRPAIRDGAKLVRDAARVNASPGLTGANARTIKVRAGRGRRGAVNIRVVTGFRADLGIPSSSPYYYPSAVEFGTAKMAARPFLRPALDSNRAAVLALISSSAWRRLEALGLGRSPPADGGDD